MRAVLMAADLHALLRARALVAVANPANGSSWTGHVIALHDDRSAHRAVRVRHQLQDFFLG